MSDRIYTIHGYAPVAEYALWLGEHKAERYPDPPTDAEAAIDELANAQLERDDLLWRIEWRLE